MRSWPTLTASSRAATSPSGSQQVKGRASPVGGTQRSAGADIRAHVGRGRIHQGRANGTPTGSKRCFIWRSRSRCRPTRSSTASCRASPTQRTRATLTSSSSTTSRAPSATWQLSTATACAKDYRQQHSQDTWILAPPTPAGQPGRCSHTTKMQNFVDNTCADGGFDGGSAQQQRKREAVKNTRRKNPAFASFFQTRPHQRCVHGRGRGCRGGKRGHMNRSRPTVILMPPPAWAAPLS